MGAKVTHIITDLKTGGAERMLVKLLKRMDPQRIQSRVITLMDGGRLAEEIKDLGFSIQGLGMKPGRPSLRSMIRLSRLLKGERSNILQGWMYHGNLMASLGKRFSKGAPRVVWNIRQSLSDMKYEKPLTALIIRLGKRWSRNADAIIYNSRDSFQKHSTFGYASERSHVIPNGFDPDSFRPQRNKTSERKLKWGMEVEDLVIGMLGRYHEVKSYPTFLKAIRIVQSKRKSVKALLAGTHINNQNSELRQIIQELRLEDKVICLGELKEPSNFFSGIDIFCSVSAWGESFPNVLGEAMACGIPCVATRLGDIPDILGKGGLLIQPKDSEALAEQIIKLIDCGEPGRLKIGLEGRKRIIEHFTIDRIAKAYEDLYEGLCEQKEKLSQCVAS